MANPSDYVLDQDGDLTLLVGTNPANTMRVDSRALCRCSPVFSIMLKGPFVESTSRCSSAAWQVALPDDNPQALLIIMDIIHHRWEHTSTKPALSTLCHMLSLANKYDMVKALRSVANTWLEHARSEIKGASVDGREAYLFVAYELGDVDLFEEITFRLAVRCAANEEGHVLTADGQGRLVDDEFVKRTNAIENIQNCRLQYLSLLQSVCQRGLYRIATEDSEHCTKKERRQRDALMGQVLKGARAHQISALFLPSANSLGFSWCINDLVSKLKSIREGIPQDLTETRRWYMPMTYYDDAYKTLEHGLLSSERQKKYMAAQAAVMQIVAEQGGHHLNLTVRWPWSWGY